MRVPDEEAGVEESAGHTWAESCTPAAAEARRAGNASKIEEILRSADRTGTIKPPFPAPATSSEKQP
jgi:hypothetical protein